MHFTSEFKKYYIETFKPQAEKCAKGFQKMVAIEKGETPKEDDPDFIYIKSCVDANAIWFIGLLIGDVDIAMIKGKRLDTINSASTVHGCLTSASYWQNVWGHENKDCDEYKNLKALSEMLENFIQLFGQSEKVDFFETIESLSKSEGVKEFFKNVPGHEE